MFTSTDDIELKKVLGKRDVMALIFGTMVGWTWVVLPAIWIGEAGIAGALMAFLATGALCVLVGIVFSELIAAFPLAGGVMVFAYRGLGYKFAWITAWLIAFAYIGVSAWEMIGISTAFDYLFTLPKLGYLWTIAGYDVYLSWSMVGIVTAILMTALHLMGVKPSAIFQVTTCLGIVLIGAIFLFGSVSFGDAMNMKPLLTDFGGWTTVLLLAPSMYIGFDIIAESAEEMKMPVRSIGKIMITSILLVAIWYALIIIAYAMSTPPGMRALQTVPAADAASLLFKSPLAGKMIIIGGFLGAISSWNGFMLASSRLLFAMGRAKMIPAFFSYLHPKTKVPVYPVLMIGLICALAPLLGKNALVWFLDVNALLTVIAYLFVSLAFITLRIREPELHRPYKAAGGTFTGILALLISAGFLILYIPHGYLKNSFEWGLTIGWLLFGAALALAAKIMHGEIDDRTRGYLICRRFTESGQPNQTTHIRGD